MKDILCPLQYTTSLVHPRVVLARVAGRAVTLPQLSSCDPSVRPSLGNDHGREPMTRCRHGLSAAVALFMSLEDLRTCFHEKIGNPERVLVHVYHHPELVTVYTMEERLLCGHELRRLDVRLLGRSDRIVHPRAVDKQVALEKARDGLIPGLGFFVPKQKT